MKILVSQKGSKLLAEFLYQGAVHKYYLDKADSLLEALDNFFRRYKLNFVLLTEANLEFRGTGMLTERVSRAIVKGLVFNNK